MNQKNEKAFTTEHILLIGLGGVGSRVVNSIMDNVPSEYKPYTQAVAVDSDRNDLRYLNNIPAENVITLGTSGTIGSFMKKNEDAAHWMIKGRQLDFIKSKTTSNGAKQIRLVSRIALQETIQNGDFDRKFAGVFNSFNAIDDGAQDKKLRVFVVCSVAGGTGAGIVIQLPMYLEDIIKRSYSSENVQFECAMLMPNMFAEKFSANNFERARANAYAVVKEIVSLNSGKIKRNEYLDSIDADDNDDRGVPYGRIMLFDDTTGKGETVKGSTDVVRTLHVVDALTEYLYGPVNGKFVSALDNNLTAIYSSGGEAIFGAVGKASVIYPREIYQQYVALKWLEGSISEKWLYPDCKAEEAYQRLLEEAEKQGIEVDEKIKSDIYSDAVLSAGSAFFDSIKTQLSSEFSYAQSLAEEFLEDIISEFVERYLREKNDMLIMWYNSRFRDKFILNKSSDLPDIKGTFRKYYDDLSEVRCKVHSFVNSVMCYEGAEKEEEPENKDDANGINIAEFIKNKNLHPIALRVFLYDLREVLDNSIAYAEIPDISKMTDSDWRHMLEKRRNIRNERVKRLVSDMFFSAQHKCKSDIAMKMLPFVEELIREVESFFESLKVTQESLSKKAEKLLSMVEYLDSTDNKVIAGSAISVRNCWKLFEKKIYNKKLKYTIEDELSEKLHKLICEGYLNHINGAPRTTIKIGSDLFRLETKYSEILLREFYDYFNNKIQEEYSSFFPENVIDAVKYDCCVKTFRNIMKNEIPCITDEDFICEEPTNEEYYQEAKEKGLSVFDFKETLIKLLVRGVEKAEPRCGIVNFDTEGDYTTRYVIMNEDILQKTTKEANDEDIFEQKLVPVYSEFVPGVSTTDIEGAFVNPCFNGPSRDTITFVTSYSGLCASDFALLVDQSCNERDSQHEKSYFRAYRGCINRISEEDSCITPHLRCDWHLPGKLIDISY